MRRKVQQEIRYGKGEFLLPQQNSKIISIELRQIFLIKSSDIS